MNNSVNSVVSELNPNQQPLGSQFKSYELNSAVNYYLLDPFQYAITKFNFAKENVPGAFGTDNDNNSINTGNNCVTSSSFKNDPGLIYKGVDFERLLPAYTATKKSVNDFPAQSYHRFLANDGYFNPSEGTNNSDLWYYGADSGKKIVTGAALNVQEINHIIFPEPQRGGLNSSNLAKYSSTGNIPNSNEYNCKFFDYNSNYSGTGSQSVPFNRTYNFDSNYCRDIGISSPTSGSMPYYNNGN